MRDFKGTTDEFAIAGSGGVSGVSWPVFKWGGGKEDKYFARLGKNLISVYETENFFLLDKKSLKVENVMDFSWSPTDPILALFVPELGGGNEPARVLSMRRLGGAGAVVPLITDGQAESPGYATGSSSQTGHPGDDDGDDVAVDL
ncbi:hypothetical protein CsatA_016369 [Cannabis sativa]